MLVLCTGINIEIVQKLVTKLGLGQHSLNNFPHKSLSAVRLCHELCRSGLALAAGITGVTQINPVSPFLAGQDNLVVIDDQQNYLGFLSRANTFSAYRRFISATSDE